MRGRLFLKKTMPLTRIPARTVEDPAPPTTTDDLTTEAGDTLTTEAGDTLTTEG
jgi:hypothetical protein